jgi:hypothetical protein
MTAAANDHLELIGAGKKNGRYDILLVIHTNDHLRSAVGNQAVPQSSVEQISEVGVSGGGDHACAGFFQGIDIHRSFIYQSFGVPSS